MIQPSKHKLRPGQKLGKYRILKRLARGGFAEVFKALDTIEGVPVALKVPHVGKLSKESLDEFTREVRLTARLDHPNILPIKNAEFIGELFVVTTLLGEGELGELVGRRLPVARVLEYLHQLLRAVAHAHTHRIIHCDLKPENLILFPKNRIRLTDFGISRVAARTMSASGSGTVGYLAPEQALGRPTFRSDVFSIGLIAWELLSGALPTWPFAWPLPGADKVERKVHPDFVVFLRRAMEVDQYLRFADAGEMLSAFESLRSRRRLLPAPHRRRRATTASGLDWKAIRRKQFIREFKRSLELRHACTRCKGPVSESMQACPWCGSARRVHRDESRFPATCPRCKRGRKLDWRFCPWCHGPGFKDVAEQSYSDVRYCATCARCKGELMPFMRYCPWCRAKVRRAWKIEGTSDRCGSCGWGVVREYWDVCPWCTKSLKKRHGSTR